MRQTAKGMRQTAPVLLLSLAAAITMGCGGKKKTDDIIAPQVVKTQPKAPERMQEYTDERDVAWIGRTYHVAIHRQPVDSLPMVKDETGQKFVDNAFSMTVSRQDGSIFFSRTFTKNHVAAHLNDNYRRTGIFEGLVFDKADGDYLVFAASVGHPNSDEYIPLVIRLSRMGDLHIERDTQMDTQPTAEEEDI